MRTRSLLSAAAYVATASAGVSDVASAQDGATLRPVANYRVTAAARQRSSIERLAVADSAGQLVGRVWLRGETAPRPADVTVEDGNIVLRGATPNGPLEFVLHRQNERPSQRLTSGRWSVGPMAGTLVAMTRS